MTAVILTSVLSVLNSALYVSSRMLYVLYFTIAAFLIVLVAMGVLDKTRPELMTSLISLAVVLTAYGLRQWTQRPLSRRNLVIGVDTNRKITAR